jgi:hypothetical protein
MAENNSFIDEVMGFDPSAVATAFENSGANERKVNPNIYKTNPKDATASEDGNYHSRVRVLLNPYNLKRNIVHQARYSMKDQNGFFQAISPLSNGDKNCPIFKGWKKLWFATKPDPEDATKQIPDAEKKAWARAKFDKSESDWVLIQVVEDDNKPDLVGMFKVMKMPSVVLNRLLAKMNPSDSKKQKQPLMDYLFGPCLEMNVAPGPDDPDKPERKQREINYDLCDFETDPTPIMKVDGTPLFSDDEIEMIEDYNSANNDMVKAKTENKRNEAMKRKEELAPKIRPLYGKAIEYIKENAIDPVVECGYSPWDEALTARVNAWLEKILRMEDPELNIAPMPEQTTSEEHVEMQSSTQEYTAANTQADDDLPF